VLRTRLNPLAAALRVAASARKCRPLGLSAKEQVFAPSLVALLQSRPRQMRCPARTRTRSRSRQAAVNTGDLHHQCAIPDAAASSIRRAGDESLELEGFGERVTVTPSRGSGLESSPPTGMALKPPRAPAANRCIDWVWVVGPMMGAGVVHHIDDTGPLTHQVSDGLKGREQLQGGGNDGLPSPRSCRA